MITQRDQLLRRAVTGNTKIYHFDFTTGARRALAQPTLEHGAKTAFERNLKRLSVRIPEHRDAHCIRRLGLVVLAIAQMGVHLVFFLHITTGPDNTNNVLALAFGILIVFLVVAGSLWIMSNLNDNMMPPAELMSMPMRH